MYEVEQKFRVAELRSIESKLQQLGATFLNPISQKDRYFAHPSRDFAETDEALRIRCIGSQNFITYKGPKIDSTTKTRREIELPLADGTDTADKYAELLMAIGFELVAEVRKHRTCANLVWNGHEVEAALDNVTHVGTFVELELSADDENLDAARACLAELGDKLELFDVERRSYLELLLECIT